VRQLFKALGVVRMNCSFDLPRSNISDNLFEIQQLDVSTLYLERIQTYRGHCVLIFDPRHVTRIDELSPEEWQLMSSDIMNVEKTLIDVFQPDHINIASLGQVVPHLHWHIIPRYTGDPRWGGPIWTTTEEEMEKVYLAEEKYECLADEIRNKLNGNDT
jgi:diadenosine tetraphosphate (Ap4A) HIT family hydrolase